MSQPPRFLWPSDYWASFPLPATPGGPPMGLNMFGSTDPVGPDADLSYYHPRGQALSPPDPSPAPPPVGSPAVCEPMIRNATITRMPPSGSPQAADRSFTEPVVLHDVSNIERGIWSYRGITLLSDDHCAISLDDLTEFVAWVRKHIPDGVIRVHQHGLRAYEMDGSRNGPHLDWRDWD